MTKKTGLILVVVMCCLSTGIAYGADSSEPGKTYGEAVKSKLRFGAKNLAMGWTDLIYEPNRALAKKESFFKGMGKGISDTFLNMGGGFLNIITCPFAGTVPLPDGGVDLG